LFQNVSRHINIFQIGVVFLGDFVRFDDNSLFGWIHWWYLG